MKHISLFSGIGGFDLAAQWMGWENVAHCEWNTFGQFNLTNYWPNAKTHTDITTTDFTIYRGVIDILTGGFPCQPYSSAGKRKGKEDNRHLWPEMLRAIREIQPTWIVGENVRGLTNWNGGLVFDEVQADLENEGYEVTPFLLPACAVNAPHRRDRIWFIAYSNKCAKRSSGKGREVESDRCQNDDQSSSRGTASEQYNGCSNVLRSSSDAESIGGRERIRKEVNNIQERKSREYISEGCEIWNRYKTTCGTGISSNSNSERLKEFNSSGITGNEERQFDEKIYIPENWENFPSQSPVCDGDDGFPTESLRQFFREDSNGILSEEEIDKILHDTYGTWRKETIKAGGNAIVPQVALQIFKAIEQYIQTTSTL